MVTSFCIEENLDTEDKRDINLFYIHQSDCTAFENYKWI